MIATVECYIHHRTNKEIRIAKPKTANQYYLLSLAFDKCKGYFL